MRFWFIALLVITMTGFSVQAQHSNLRIRKIKAEPGKEIQLDSLAIYKPSLKVTCGGVQLTENQYLINLARTEFTLTEPISCDSIFIVYRVFQLNTTKRFYLRDTSIIYEEKKGNRDLFLIEPTNEPFEMFGNSGLEKSGSISRGIGFGNRQNLSVNSTLNLELSGYIAPNLQVLANITDNNLPIQPEGNTNKLQEFDQVFIQFFNSDFKLTVGDFWIDKPTGYFLSYKKRGQGLTGEYNLKTASGRKIYTQASGALSKGKFNRQIISGIEGNQGPYRLRGNENEPFIIVLSGTERIFIDGKLVQRGQDLDYVIDYNTSEITFTAKQLITKDSRIVAEFQYSDQNYARSLFQFSAGEKGKKIDWWFNAYTEQDAKNQTLQQDLADEDKFLLTQIGDQLDLARVQSVDSIGYTENQVMYKLIDSLGYDSVLVASVQPNLAIYRARFSQVGANKGDYILQSFNALGRVYQWVAPINGIPQGDYAPVILLITPKKQQLVNLGMSYRITPGFTLKTELARSGFDKNTFSRLDRFDDVGYGLKNTVVHEKKLRNDSIKTLKWINEWSTEWLDTYFKPIEQYRSVEFDRDWNTRNKNYSGGQFYTNYSTGIQSDKNGKINLEGEIYRFGTDYLGKRANTTLDWTQNGWKILGDASILGASDKINNNQFIRHRLDISKKINRITVGFKDDQEQNIFKIDSIKNYSATSYSFWDNQGYLSFGDSISGSIRVSYRERIDDKPVIDRLKRAAKAKTWGLEWTKNNWKNQQLTVVVNYRELRINDSTLINQAPENTTNGRIDHSLRILKNGITLTTFYEVGSGLEQRRTFIYLKVNDGQGVYTWIDYNSDGVKDLNEFEIASYSDQASYIRVFTPSNAYSKAYSNEYNQSLVIRPERWLGNATGFKGVIARFSTQTRMRIQRKTSVFDAANTYNPFVTRIDDAALVSASSTMKHTFFFNRTSALFAADYSLSRNNSKTLLATGFDGRSSAIQDVNVRWNITKAFILESNYEQGNKLNLVDYTVGRNYKLNYWNTKSSFSYQPNTVFRISLETRFSNKENAVEYGGETAFIRDIGVQFKYNQTEQGSLQAQFNTIQIRYVGEVNSPVGFELLEALKPGQNMVWNASYQRSVSKNLQLSFTYNGRKSEGNKTIHAGGMELRAFF